MIANYSHQSLDNLSSLSDDEVIKLFKLYFNVPPDILTIIDNLSAVDRAQLAPLFRDKLKEFAPKILELVEKSKKDKYEQLLEQRKSVSYQSDQAMITRP